MNIQLIYGMPYLEMWGVSRALAEQPQGILHPPRRRLITGAAESRLTSLKRRDRGLLPCYVAIEISHG